jgi:two-component system sensor histidine kinase/response regulator
MSELERVLLIDDDAADRAAIRRALADGAKLGGGSVEVEEQDSGVGVLEVLAARRYDCILLDYNLPAPSGLEVVRAIRGAGVATPIVILTGREDVVIAEAIAAGATDFLHKPDVSPVRVLERLRHAVRLGKAEEEAAAATRAREVELGILRRAIRTRDQLLDLAGHDLRNPLHSMAIALSELENAELPEAVRMQYLGAARRSVDRMERLVRDILDIGHIESGSMRYELQSTPIATLFEQLGAEHQAAANAAGVPLMLAVDGEPGPVMVDPARARQVIGKLIANTMKHAKGSGPVTVRARRVEDGGHFAIEIAVTDRGPGFPPALLPLLFDREADAQRTRRGSGLGLALAQGLSLGMGGTIAASNVAEPAGAEVRVRFPLASVAAGTPPAP